MVGAGVGAAVVGAGVGALVGQVTITGSTQYDRLGWVVVG
jgi:hypothetical protein